MVLRQHYSSHNARQCVRGLRLYGYHNKKVQAMSMITSLGNEYRIMNSYNGRANYNTNPIPVRYNLFTF